MHTNKPQTSAPRFSRRYARYFAIQGMYQWLINPSDSQNIETYIRFNPVGLPSHFTSDKTAPQKPQVQQPQILIQTEVEQGLKVKDISNSSDISVLEENININELKELKSMFHDHKRDEKFLQSDFADGFIMIDELLFKTLFNGMLEHHTKDCEVLQTVLDRPFQQLSVVEKAVLLLGTFELLHMDTPYKVVINEAIDLCKVFGSGQRYINGALDNLAKQLLKK